MLDLNQMSVFIRVVQEGSFTAAARSLGMPKSRVSRMITDLESKLEIRLLERTTREVRPTDVGLEYYQQYKPLFEEINDIHARISDHQTEPSGHLRVTAPVGFAISMMGNLTAEFKKQYPKIDFELMFNDGEINLIRDGFDVGFALGDLQDSSLIARKFDDTDPILCASPDFIKEYGPFNHPEELNKVPWVNIGSHDGHFHRASFVHAQSGEQCEIQPNDAIKMNHHEVALQHVIAGNGLAISSSFFTYEQLLNGQLEIILPDWQIEAEPVYLIFPSGKHQAKKVRAFIDFFLEKSKQIKTLTEQTKYPSTEQQIQQLHQIIGRK